MNVLERVTQSVDLPEYQLRAGNMGTMVDLPGDGQEYTIEFFTLDGETFAVVPVLIHQMRRVGSREIAAARQLD